VTTHVDILNQTKSALSAASITSITGTYGAACDGRSVSGNDTWTISISGGPAGDELSVRRHDTDCVLSVDDIVTAGGTYVGSPAIDLATSYAGSASAFALSGTLTFYGNAKISALAYDTNFTITLLVSDAPGASAAPDKGASFDTENGTVTPGNVSASDYTIDYSGFGIQKDVDNVVQSVSGYGQLTAGSATGQDYAIYEGDLTGASTLAAVETAYSGAASHGSLSALTTLELQAADFNLVSLDLDNSPQRTVIIRNTDQGVSAYQLLRITFVP